MSKVQILYKYQEHLVPNPAIVEFERKFRQLFMLTQTKSTYIAEPLITPKEALTEVTQVGVLPSKMVRGKPLTVFQTSGLVEDINERVWYYQDEKKQTHGPLSSREMDTLLTSGRITMQTRVALRSLEKFIRIEKIMQAISQPQPQQTQAQQPPLPAVIPEPALKEKEIKEPFRFSNLTKDFEVYIHYSQLLLWFYKQGMQDHKGPISTTQMDLLWQQDIVNANTKIGFQDTTKFVKMEKILSLAKHGLEEERKKKEEEQRIKDKGGFLDYQVDLSKVKQNTNLGEWGQPLVAKPVQVVVINPHKQESSKVKTQPTEGRKRSDNKSLHVEGHQGNLYHKQPKVETIIEEEQQEKKQQEIQQILQKLADKTVEKNQPKQNKHAKQQVIYEVKQPAEQPKQVQIQAEVKKVEEPKQQSKPQDKQTTQPKPQAVKEQPKQEIKIEEPKVVDHDEIKNEIIKETKVEENEDDGWQEVSAPQAKKKNHKQQNKNAHVVGYAGKVDPPKITTQPIKQVTQVTKTEVKVEQKQPVPSNVVQTKNEPEEVDDGWQEVVKPVRAKPQKK